MEEFRIKYRHTVLLKLGNSIKRIKKKNFDCKIKLPNLTLRQLTKITSAAKIYRISKMETQKRAENFQKYK